MARVLLVFFLLLGGFSVAWAETSRSEIFSSVLADLSQNYVDAHRAGQAHLFQKLVNRMLGELGPGHQLLRAKKYKHSVQQAQRQRLKFISLGKSRAYLKIPHFFQPARLHSERLLQKFLKTHSSRRRGNESQSAGLIIDLRGNSFGEDKAALELALNFLRSGQILIRTLLEDGVKKNKFTVERNGFADQVSLVILVDKTTAGPAEVFAASLQDQIRTVVLGERTAGQAYGYQDFYIGEEKNWLLRLAVRSYLRKDGSLLSTAGVTPDSNQKFAQAGRQDLMSTAKDPLVQQGLSILQDRQQIDQRWKTQVLPSVSPGSPSDLSRRDPR